MVVCGIGRKPFLLPQNIAGIRYHIQIAPDHFITDPITHKRIKNLNPERHHQSHHSRRQNSSTHPPNAFQDKNHPNPNPVDGSIPVVPAALFGIPTTDAQKNGVLNRNPYQHPNRKIGRTKKKTESTGVKDAKAEEREAARKYVCPIEGCDKRYQQTSGLKYHLSNGTEHAQEIQRDKVHIDELIVKSTMNMLKAREALVAPSSKTQELSSRNQQPTTFKPDSSSNPAEINRSATANSQTRPHSSAGPPAHPPPPPQLTIQAHTIPSTQPIAHSTSRQSFTHLHPQQHKQQPPSHHQPQHPSTNHNPQIPAALRPTLNHHPAHRSPQSSSLPRPSQALNNPNASGASSHQHPNTFHLNHQYHNVHTSTSPASQSALHPTLSSSLPARLVHHSPLLSTTPTTSTTTPLDSSVGSQLASSSTPHHHHYHPSNHQQHYFTYLPQQPQAPTPNHSDSHHYHHPKSHPHHPGAAHPTSTTPTPIHNALKPRSNLNNQ